MVFVRVLLGAAFLVMPFALRAERASAAPLSLVPAPEGGVSAGLPFYAVTRSEETNVRAGPNARYPIRWVYRRKNWPVKIVAEFENWYRFEDMYGEAGWA